VPNWSVHALTTLSQDNQKPAVSKTIAMPDAIVPINSDAMVTWAGVLRFAAVMDLCSHSSTAQSIQKQQFQLSNEPIQPKSLLTSADNLFHCACDA
jgi:hypothetical protein